MVLFIFNHTEIPSSLTLANSAQSAADATEDNDDNQSDEDEDNHSFTIRAVFLGQL